jgi:hypothetical protein
MDEIREIVEGASIGDILSQLTRQIRKPMNITLDEQIWRMSWVRLDDPITPYLEILQGVGDSVRITRESIEELMADVPEMEVIEIPEDAMRFVFK